MDCYLFNIPLLETSINSDGRTIRAEDTLETVRHAVLELFGHVAKPTRGTDNDCQC